MLDDTNPGAATPQAGETAQPQAGTSSTGQAPGAQSSAAAASGTGESTDPRIATLERELEAARREAAKHRTENQRLTAAQEAKAKTEADRITDLEKRLADADALVKEKDLAEAILASATRMGFLYPDLVAPLVRESLTLDEDGKPKNLDTVLRALAQNKPKLLRSSPDFGGGNRGGAGPQKTDMNAFIRRAAGRID